VHGQPELSPGAQRVMAVFGVLGGALLLVVGLALMGLLFPIMGVAWEQRDVIFFIGALLLVGWAVVAVSIAGPNLTRGIMFHLVGVLGPFSLGSTWAAFERLRVAGGMIYLTAWCWVFLGDTVVRLVRERRAAGE
jgi:hypothetical protein